MLHWHEKNKMTSCLLQNPEKRGFFQGQQNQSQHGKAVACRRKLIHLDVWALEQWSSRHVTCSEFSVFTSLTLPWPDFHKCCPFAMQPEFNRSVGQPVPQRPCSGNVNSAWSFPSDEASDFGKALRNTLVLKESTKQRAAWHGLIGNKFLHVAFGGFLGAWISSMQV